jgi:hypothetical protein
MIRQRDKMSVLEKGSFFPGGVKFAGIAGEARKTGDSIKVSLTKWERRVKDTSD